MSCMAGGCRISYKLNGAAIDYTVYKTIYVSNFPIRAALVYPPLQQTFENELLDYITRNTRLRTIDTNNADLQLEGEIVGYNLSPQAVTEKRLCLTHPTDHSGKDHLHRQPPGGQGHQSDLQRLPRL